MNTVYGPNTDLSFIENFIEFTKIYSTEAPNAVPLTHDCFIRKKGFILILDIYEDPREILETPVQLFLVSPPTCSTSSQPSSLPIRSCVLGLMVEQAAGLDYVESQLRKVNSDQKTKPKEQVHVKYWFSTLSHLSS